MKRFVISGKYVKDLLTKKQYSILFYRKHSVLCYPFCINFPHVIHKDESGRLFLFEK